jgi:hypothetical protein
MDTQLRKALDSYIEQFVWKTLRINDVSFSCEYCEVVQTRQGLAAMGDVPVYDQYTLVPVGESEEDAELSVCQECAFFIISYSHEFKYGKPIAKSVFKSRTTYKKKKLSPMAEAAKKKAQELAMTATDNKQIIENVKVDTNLKAYTKFWEVVTAKICEKTLGVPYQKLGEMIGDKSQIAKRLCTDGKWDLDNNFVMSLYSQAFVQGRHMSDKQKDHIMKFGVNGVQDWQVKNKIPRPSFTPPQVQETVAMVHFLMTGYTGKQSNYEMIRSIGTFIEKNKYITPKQMNVLIALYFITAKQTPGAATGIIKPWMSEFAKQLPSTSTS